MSQEAKYTDPPSPFVAEWVSRLASRMPARRRALDVAMGHGRHALLLAECDFRVFGVDIDHAAVRDATRRAATRGLNILGWTADLTEYPMASSYFDLIVVTRYLDRRMIEALKNAVVPGGAIVYETFTVGQLGLGRGPRSPEHLLEHGELRRLFDDFEVIYSRELDWPDAVAQLVGIRGGDSNLGALAPLA